LNYFSGLLAAGLEGGGRPAAGHPRGPLGSSNPRERLSCAARYRYHAVPL